MQNAECRMQNGLNLPAANSYWIGGADVAVEGGGRWGRGNTLLSSMATLVESAVSWVPSHPTIDSSYNVIYWYSPNKYFYMGYAAWGFRYICQHRRIRPSLFHTSFLYNSDSLLHENPYAQCHILYYQSCLTFCNFYLIFD